MAEEINREIRNSKIIDEKLKDAFSKIKRDIEEIKKATKEKNKNSEDLESLKKELDSLKKEKEINKAIESERKEIEELKQKISIQNQRENLAEEEQKRKEEIEEKYSELYGSFEKKQEEISGICSKAIENLDAQFRKLLKEIQKENLKSLVKGEKERLEAVKFYDSRIKELERKRREEIENIKEVYSKEMEILEKGHRQFEKEAFKKLNESESSNARFTSAISDIIKSQNSQFNSRLRESEKRFEKLIRYIEEKRNEDTALILKNLSRQGIKQAEAMEETKPQKQEKKQEKAGVGFWSRLFAKSDGQEKEERLYEKPLLKEVKKEKPKIKEFKDEERADYSKTQGIFWKVIPYIFLLILALLALNQYFKWQLVTQWNNQIVVLGILMGAGTFWKNRKKIETDLDNEKRSEELDEEIRKREFPFKFPTINKIPVLRNIVRWGYKEGWVYSLIVISLVVVGFFIRLYRLGELSLWWDELITGRVVTRILETGFPLEPSGLVYYWRGIAYHYVVSLFTFIFGNTEFWLRFPSVLFGMGIVIISFIFAKKINKWNGLLVLLFLTFSTYNIEYSRFARLYIMNAFLFMLSLLFVYKGLFLKQRKYLWISLFVFVLMVHTVKLGSFYIFAIGTYIIYLLIFIFFNKNNTPKRNTMITLLFIFISILTAIIGNFFERITWLVSKISGKEIYAYQLLQNIPEPATYPLLKLPNWALFSFFNQYYISIVFILTSVILGFFIFLNDVKLKRTLSWFAYIIITLFISIIGYEIINRNVSGARIFLFVEGIYVIVIVSLIVILFKHLFRKDLLYRVLSLIMIVLLLSSITPYFYKRVSVNYGDNVLNDPFRTTQVAAYRADYSNTYDYLKENINDSDIWINVMGPNYFIFNKSPDYILNQNFRWNTFSFVQGKDFIEPSTGSKLISYSKDIDSIIKESNRRVWLLVNGGSINIIDTTHVRNDFIAFLNENKDKIVYESKDGYSKVLLFKQINQSAN